MTKYLFVKKQIQFLWKAQSEREVRSKLKPYNYNIEFIQQVEGAFLEYEKQSENFKVLEL